MKIGGCVLEGDVLRKMGFDVGVWGLDMIESVGGWLVEMK